MTTKYIVDNVSGQTVNDNPIDPKYKVYTALLTQIGVSSTQLITTGDLTVGVTYLIPSRALPGSADWDFTNVGAPNNDMGTYFVATGTTPNNWGVYGELEFNEGAPVVTVIENTLGGDITFTYFDVGNYRAISDSLFTDNKTYTILGGLGSFSSGSIQQSSTTIALSTAVGGVYSNDGLIKTSLEIRVYN